MGKYRFTIEVRDALKGPDSIQVTGEDLGEAWNEGFQKYLYELREWAKSQPIYNNGKGEKGSYSSPFPDKQEAERLRREYMNQLTEYFGNLQKQKTCPSCGRCKDCGNASPQEPNPYKKFEVTY